MPFPELPGLPSVMMLISPPSPLLSLPCAARIIITIVCEFSQLIFFFFFNIFDISFPVMVDDSVV